ncbi:unnamed protein product [Closterium sp. NIES-54]
MCVIGAPTAPASRRPCCPVPSRRPCCPVPCRRPCCPVASPLAVLSRPVVLAVPSRPVVPTVPSCRPPSVPPHHAVRPVHVALSVLSRRTHPVHPARPSRPRCALPVRRAPCALPVRRAPCALPVRRAPAAPCPSVAPRAPCLSAPVAPGFGSSSIHLCASAMATPRVMQFDAEGRPLEFSVWLLRARRLLESQVQAHETLWAHASGDLPEAADPAPLAADPKPADSDRYAHKRVDVTAWKSRDASACIALNSLLPESEETHFTQVRTASEFLTAIKARYATPTTVSLGRLFLPFLFLDLASFECTADLITHMRSLDSSYRAACTDTQLALLPPPMAITIYFIATSLPHRLASVRDALLLKHPSELTIEVLDSALKDVESNLRSIASASGVVPPPLFHGCTVPQLPTFTASLATAATNVTAAAVTNSSRSRGRSGRRGGQGAGGGGGGDVASGGGGSAGAGGAPCAVAGDSPTAAGGGDARQQQQQQPLPSQQPQQQQRQQQVSGQGSGQRQLQCGVVHPPSTYHVLTGARRSQPCGRSHPPGQCFAQLTDTVRLAYGVDSPAPDWLPLVQTYGPALWGMSTSQLVDLFGTPHAIYVVVDSSASDSVYSSVVSLGASLAEASRVSCRRCPPLLAPPCGPFVEGRLRATPHSSSLRPATEPLETLHLDVWGPALRPGPERERFFLVVVDDYSRYTTVFPLAKKSDVTSTLIWWLLTTADTRGRCVSCLHSDRGGEFCSGILAGFCREQGIQSPESPQQNGVAEHRIGLVMEIARTSMTHARAPHFLWPYAVWYAAHQLNLRPRVSRPEVSPISLWTGSPGAASRFRVWGCLALVRKTSTDKILPRAVSCVFLGFPEDSSDYTFYHPPLHRFFDSRDVRFDESVPFYVRYPCRGLLVPPAPLFLTSAPPPAPPVQPPPPGPAPSGVSHATPPPSVAPQVQPPSPQSSSQPTADPAGAGFCGEDPGGASSRGVGIGAESVHVRGPGSGGAGVGAEPVTAGDSSLRGASVSGAVPGGATTWGAPSAGPGEPGTDPVTSGGAGSGGGATSSLESAAIVGARGERVGAAVAGATAAGGAAATAAAAAGAGAAAAAAAAAAIAAAAIAAAAATAAAATSSSCLWSSDPQSSLSFSSLPPLSSRLTASLSIPVIDYYRTYRPVLSRVLASLVTDPRASLSSVSVLTAAITEFASTCCLDYATSLVAAPPTIPLAIGGEFALGCDALEDRQFELEFLAAASPHLCAMLLASEGDPDALDMPTPRTYAEAVSGPWASQWRAAMDSEMASYRSIGTYVNEVPPLGANVVDGMWIFRVKWPPGSPPVFKARYVARGFSQREGVDFFQTFAPTPKMTTLRVLLHVAA